MDFLYFAGLLMMAVIALKIGYIVYQHHTKEKKDGDVKSYFD